MTRTRAFCLVMLLVALVAFQAQAGPLGKGIKAGITYTKITNDSEFLSDSDHKMGFAAGVSVSYDLIPGLSLQPELLYVQQGGQWDVNIVEGGVITGSGQLTWKLNYIQVPVLARVSLPVVGAVLPTIIGGPALAIKAAQSYEVEGGGSVLEAGDLDDLKSTDLSLILGLAMKVGAGPAGVTVDVRYNLGSSNLNDADTDVKVNNRGFQVLAGFQF